MKEYFKLIKIKHWLKNFLVFLPLFFNGQINNWHLLLLNAVCFMAFNFTASIVYILNDIFDIKNDRLNPKRKNRPLASGKISVKKAIVVMLILAILLGITLFYLYKEIKTIYLFIIPILYIVINFLYSIWLKRVAIIDVLILVSGFVLRIIFGSIIVGVTISKYLYLMIIFGSYYLSFGKRRGELMHNGIKSRDSLKKYNTEFLNKNMYVAYGLSIVSYTLWCVDSEVQLRLGHGYMFLTIPFLITIFQLYSLDIENNSYGDPIEVILSNKLLLVTGIVFVILMIYLLYFL